MAEDKAKVEGKKPQKPEGKPAKEAPVVDPDFKHLVRISGVVLDGNQTIVRGLTKLKGIGPQISSSLDNVLGLKHDRKIGSLNEEEVAKVESIIENLDKHFPSWMLNRRKDYSTGNDMHLLGSDLDMSRREDIGRHQKLRSYKGIRHSMGLPVRGQRTRTSFRKGATIGVSRKKATPTVAKKT